MTAPLGLKRIAGSVAAVTGGGSGIGRATALGLASEGVHVAVLDRDEDTAATVEGEIEDSGGSGLRLGCDVTDGEAVEAAIAACVNTFGRLDILVNSAGTVGIAAEVIDLPVEQWANTLAINLTGVFLCCKAAGRHMLPQKSGRIVSISSRAAYQSPAGASAYAASKAGVAAFTRSFAREMAAHNITVNAVAPGTTDTPMARAFHEDLQRVVSEGQHANPMGSVMEAEDIANAVIFLCSENARFITGQTVHVNAGSWMP